MHILLLILHADGEANLQDDTKKRGKHEVQND